MAKSPLRYPGGKGRAAERIVEVIRQYPMQTYWEPMLGGASVALALREVWGGPMYLSDRYEALATFWRVVQDPCMRLELMGTLKNVHTMHETVEQRKTLFHELRRFNPEYPVQQAARLFLLNRMSFSGATEAGGFSASAAMDRFTLSSIERIREAGDTLSKGIVQIAYDSCIERVAALPRMAMVFLDPPYIKASKLYGKGGVLHQFPHDKLAFLLQKVYKGSFVLTLDDCDETRSLYGSWASLEPLAITYGMDNIGGKGCKRAQELLITRGI